MPSKNKYVTTTLPPALAEAFEDLLEEADGEVSSSHLLRTLIEIGLEQNPEASNYVKDLAKMARVDRENNLLGIYMKRIKRIAYNAGNLERTLNVIDDSGFSNKRKKELNEISEDFNKLINKTLPTITKGYKQTAKRIKKRRRKT